MAATDRFGESCAEHDHPFRAYQSCASESQHRWADPAKGKRMIRKEPCSACPYRQDSPSGLWAAEEYDKLPPYDAPTGSQPFEIFLCHATPDHLCHGWAVVGDWELLALRLYAAYSIHEVEIPPPVVPLWSTHTQAADHGRAGIAAPSPRAMRTIHRLTRKYPRLRSSDGADPLPRLQPNSE